MSRHTGLFRLGSVFLSRTDLENTNTLVFSRFSLILHLAHHIAKFRRSCCKSLAVKHTFKLKAHCQRTGIVSFVCGVGLEGR